MATGEGFHDFSRDAYPRLVSTFGHHQPVPWVGFVSPPLPAGSRVDRVVALDGTGTVVGSLEQPYPGALCRPRRG